MTFVDEKKEMKELDELEKEIRARVKEGTIELSEEELDAITGGASSPYKKKKTLKEISKRLF